MENPRPAKVAVVEEVRQRLDSADAAILTEYRGLKVSELATLRRSLSEAGGEYRIYKNTLARLAVRDLGLAELETLLTGPTAIAFVHGDAVNVAKALRDFARTNPHLVVKGGLLGPRVLSERDAAALADLPPRDVLLARLAGGLAAPLTWLAGLLQALPRNFAYGLKALIDERGGAPENTAATEAEPAAAPAAEPETAAEAAAADTETGAEVAAETEPEAAAVTEPEAAAMTEVTAGAAIDTETETAAPAAEATETD